MKIVIVCKSHNQGGAAVVSHRLMIALCHAGHDARMLVLSPTNEVNVYSYSNTVRDEFNFLAERLQIFINNGFSRERLFAVDTARWGADISTHPWVKEADVINLNWINQGAMSLQSIKRLADMGKKIVWTMHDMWNCTGICHHAYDCQRYKGECNNCPYLGFMAADRDLSTRVQRLKAQLYAHCDIRFVAVSNWLAECCRQSSLMRHAKVTVIHNAFPIEQFSYVRHHNPSLNIPKDKSVLIMGAARLDDRVKGFDLLIDVLNHMVEHKPALAAKCHLLLYGNIRNANLLKQIAIPYTHLGKVPESQLNQLFSSSDVVLSTSRFETLPGTIIEGLASGCSAVAFDSGGQRDIIDHLESGYLARRYDVNDFVEGINWAVNTSAASREVLNSIMTKRFSAQEIAQKYIHLFEE
ncbi:MAG: glycosyltransferase [Muribaculaceae bacterium]